MTHTLTPKQAAFCDEYSIDLNGKQAALRAGYSQKGAQQTSAVLLSNHKVQKRVSKLLAERAERTQITADNILKALWDSHKLALARGDLGISNRALELCGKANRLFIDRVEHHRL